jgi:NAD(P)-dependent dehydrogenase (short-subunit alcohol dehydrogenase family)
MSFTNKHIIVTGASIGIGFATAKMLALRGAKVSMIARREDVLANAADQITRMGGAVAYESADVSDKVALRRVLDRAEGAFGPVDGLFANAGTGGQFGPITNCSDENWDFILATNLTSVFVAMRHVLPGMIARKRGSIVVTGSLASDRGMADNPAYVASKHALLGLARAAALENAAYGIRVNCLLPGLIETPLLHNIGGGDAAVAIAALAKNIPQSRIGTADETAEVACFLLSDATSHVTGQGWAVDGGILGTLALR